MVFGYFGASINGHHEFRGSVFRYVLKQGEQPEGEINGFNREIVFLYSIDHDYTHYDVDDMKFMETFTAILLTIPLGEEVKNYLILNVVRGFAGDMIRKFEFGLGSGDTDKGV